MGFILMRGINVDCLSGWYWAAMGIVIGVDLNCMIDFYRNAS